jgi:UDP:flavonoid glycosyltransferase YjiC (YdhE family)
MLSFPDWLPESVKRFYWWTADKLVVDPLIGPELNNLRKEISLPPVSRILTKWGQSPDMVIGLFPDWYGPPQIDWPQNTYLTGFPLFDEDQDKEVGVDLKSFLEAGDRPLVFMPGSLMKQAGPFFRAAVQACRELKMRGILLSRDEGQIPAGLPDTVKHLSYAPLGHILPHARALVHHGGIGTCAQALRSGVPQLIHPMAYDQFDNAWRVKRLGVGNWISQRNWQPGTVTEAIKTLTTSDVTDKQCRVVASKFADIDPLQDTCGLIESIL